MIGKTLSHYQVLEKLGEGGMGVVYRAMDTRLNRPVAVKVLPEGATADPDRTRRFVQEARAASALNHPNIITVYDVDTAGGVDFIAMEYVTGQTLDQLIGRKGLKLGEALKLAVQIADALAVAHASGIVHRDLKPANVMVTERGLVKILDFGLAKLTERLAPGDSAAADAATVEGGVQTEEGAILGTVAYMSPEQAEGKKVDARSDIFAFASLLYEMVTGRRAFHGETKVSTLSAILHTEPPAPSEIVVGVPRELDRIIALGLRKDPGRRFQHLDDVKALLEQLKEEWDSGSHSGNAGGMSAGAIASRTRSRAQPWWIAVTGVLLITSVALGWLYLGSGPAPAVAAGAIHFTIPPPEKAAFVSLTDIAFSVAVSPDGQRLALTIQADGRTQLWVRGLGGLAAQPLAGTEGASCPFWSPDSRYIGFFADGKLKKVDGAGGMPQTVCDAPRWGSAATWNRDGVIVFSTTDGIYRVAAEGGKPVRTSTPHQAGEENFWPSFLPDGRHFIFLAGLPRRDLFSGSLDSSDVTLLVKDASRAFYAPSTPSTGSGQAGSGQAPPGYLLYVRDGTLLAHPFDAGALRFTSEPIVVAEGLWFFKPTGTADFSVSQNGVLAYRAGTSTTRLIWRDRRGAEIGSVGELKDYSALRISPDGQSVAVNVSEPRTGTTDVWTYDVSRGLSTRVTVDPWMENGPIWSPNGRRIVFAASPDGAPHLYQKSLSDTGSGDVLVPLSGWVQWPYDWTLDGRFIIYSDGAPTTGNDLMIVPLDGDRKPRLFQGTQFNEADAKFSPDGRWVAYVCDESGRSEVYVRSFAESGQAVKRQVSAAGGASPRWRRDGKELFYIAPDKRLMAVPVQAGGSFETGTPTALFRVDARIVGAEYDYDVTADGQRFLINTSVTEASLMPLTTVLNWTRDLKR